MTEGLKTDLEKIKKLDCFKNILYFDRAKIDWIDYREAIIIADNIDTAKSVSRALIPSLMDANSFLATATMVDNCPELFGGFSPGANILAKYDFQALLKFAASALRAHSRVFNSTEPSLTERFQEYARDAALYFAFFRRFFAKTTGAPIIQ
ncbi:MAG: hypothetical protein LBO66_05375 [Deltaproteobacteria bacterium]|jgi:hypothetical protein|nr:hypothetical protein [Deltaproteobacteria bacterium]